MGVKVEAEVRQVQDKDEQLFFNLSHGWGQLLAHTHTHSCIAAVLRDGGNVSFGIFVSRRKLREYANMTGMAIEWDSEEGPQ